MISHKLTVVVLLAALLSTPVQAFDGNLLYKACQAANDAFEGGFCLSYIGGVVDKGGFSYVCVPYSVTYSQYRDIVKKFLSDYPEKRYKHAVDLVNEAYA